MQNSSRSWLGYRHWSPTKDIMKFGSSDLKGLVAGSCRSRSFSIGGLDWEQKMAKVMIVLSWRVLAFRALENQSFGTWISIPGYRKGEIQYQLLLVPSLSTSLALVSRPQKIAFVSLISTTTIGTNRIRPIST
jgi:hypothetical protein